MTGRASRSHGEVMSDHSLERDVMQALADNQHVQPEEIAVQVVDGKVILRGTVGSPIQRAEAVVTAGAVPGIRTVDDQLDARPLDIDSRADADTRAAVIAALVADDELHAAEIGVDARDGVVTLSGLVELQRQRDRAERIALQVGGVSQVRNHIKVWLTVSADDVAERVTDAIGADAIVGVDRITVRVTGNDVVLSGIVTTPEHREAALAAAADAPGVARVHDEITVG
jgi:hyperosmotically inducible protein